ncbi:MAG TPA: hypothetical protein PK611_06310, partial [Saprospiraceae bacterium]|nr:hypothetical protein [Saprospiraceae bacterium]
MNAQYITPNAGATQTFNVSTNGLIFTDPTDGVTGGPGGVCTTTSSGNPGDYPNCGCTTVTTICAPVGQTVSANFTSFNIFGNFDILKIFNGSNVSAPQIYDSNLNANTDNLAGMIAANGSSTFTSVGQNCLTFEFYATTVVNSCGWEAGITTSGGGGPNPPSTSLSCAGNALDFDGVNDRVTYPNGTAALVGSNFTISGWVYPKSNTNFHQGYFGWRNNTNADFYILQLDHSTNIEARFRNSGGTNFDLSTTVTLNTWQHLAMSYDGTTLKLYKNGVLVASRAANGNLTNAAVPLDIGALVFQGSYFYLNGILDEVSYWNNTGTDAQILAMFNAPTPVSAGLAALYRFNQGIAGGNNIGINTALDGSGNNRTASLSSFSLTGATSNWVQSGNFYGTFNAGIAIVENSGVPNDGVVEPGSSVTLTASGGNTYLWSTGSTNSSINVTPSVTTTYSVTITNNQGCVGVATVTITVKNANPCLLVCSGDQTISLGGGQCQYQIPNLVTGILNDCSVEIVQISKVGAGDYVGAGKYELVYKLRDKKTQFFLDSCKFTLTVKTYQPTNATLVCNDHVNISADENCIVSLNADMFLEGGPYKCYDDYKIIIWPFKSKANAYEIQQHTGLSIPLGEHTYEIVDPETGNRCWGTFTIEDKLAPTVSCNCVDDPTQVVYVTSLVDPNGNILDVNSPIFNRPTGTTPALCNPTGTTGGRRYKAFEFEVSVTGSYTFNSNLSNGDGYGLIYEDFFDPTQPCLNFITANDDGAGDLDPLITVTLTKGKKYIYVYSLFSGPTTYSTGFFINITATPTGGQVLINNNPANAPECKFKCYDLAVVQKETVDKLYGQSNDKSVLTTPPSASDGCSNVDKSFEDQVIT